MHSTTNFTSCQPSGEIPIVVALPPPDHIAAIIATEPSIGAILNEARHSGPWPNKWRAYHNFKARLSKLCGWQARRRELRESDVFNVVTAALLQIIERSEPGAASDCEAAE